MYARRVWNKPFVALTAKDALKLYGIWVVGGIVAKGIMKTLEPSMKDATEKLKEKRDDLLSDPE